MRGNMVLLVDCNNAIDNICYCNGGFWIFLVEEGERESNIGLVFPFAQYSWLRYILYRWT